MSMYPNLALQKNKINGGSIFSCSIADQRVQTAKEKTGKMQIELLLT